MGATCSDKPTYANAGKWRRFLYWGSEHHSAIHSKLCEQPTTLLFTWCMHVSPISTATVQDFVAHVKHPPKPNCSYLGLMYLYVWMDGCMDVWMDIWMDGWMDGWMHGCMDAWMHGCMDAWMDGCMDVWMNGWIVESY